MDQRDAPPEQNPTSRRPVGHWVGPSILAAEFMLLGAWTWRKWPDALVDFGRELYIPWQLSEGAVLYRDIAYLNGPFSPYFNALLFNLLGVSINTLTAANALLLALLTWLLYRWVTRLFDALTATLACSVLLTVFGFAHLMAIGNYNYISPYSHELTHGVILSLSMLLLLADRPDELNWVRRVAAGLCLGLVFLGKAEMFVAAAGGAFVALSLCWIANTGLLRKKLADGLVFLVSATAPIALFTLALATVMSPREALLGVVGSWRWILAGDAIALDYYRGILGLDQPWANLLAVIRSTALVSLVIAMAACCSRWKSDLRRRNLWAFAAATCAIAVGVFRKPLLPCLLDAKALLPITLLLTGLLIVAALRRRNRPDEFRRLAPLAAWSVFALILLAKLSLLPRIHHYGFVLAMPAVVLLVIFLIGYLPLSPKKVRPRNAVFRYVMVVVLVLDSAAFVQISADKVKRKSYQIGSGGDRITAYQPSASPVAPAVAQALREIERIMPRDATFVALPEGVMLNYLARRRNPSGYVNMMPPELAMYGEDQILASLRGSRPDFILLVHKDTTEYGVGFFGSEDYGRSILNWVVEHYDPVRTIGHQPLVDDRFGIQILRRRAKGEG